MFFHPLCSGQWAHAVFIRLKVSHCNKREGGKNAKHKGEAFAVSALSAGLGLFLLQIETKLLWKTPKRERIDLSVI